MDGSASGNPHIRGGIIPIIRLNEFEGKAPLSAVKPFCFVLVSVPASHNIGIRVVDDVASSYAFEMKIIDRRNLPAMVPIYAALDFRNPDRRGN